MAVEKMSLISVSGPLKKVNKTLVRCCETKCFHIEPSFYTMTYGSAHFKTLKDKDIYGGLMKRADVLSVGLGIKTKPFRMTIYRWRQSMTSICISQSLNSV
ncbi:MAG: hypothetical protein ACLR5P_10460 [[Eubacterium] siraeum]